MVTTLYLIRHGATEGGDAARYHGSIDIPLSGRGAEQIRAAAAFILRQMENRADSRYLSYLQDIQASRVARKADSGAGDDVSLSDVDRTPRLDAIYCSDLSRAVRSAEIIAEPHRITPVVIRGLRERSFGIWEGMTFTEIMSRYPEEFQAWATDPLRFSPMGGESTLQVRDRVIAALDEILAHHTGENVAVVAHGGVNRVILCHILGMPLEHIFRIEQDHAAVNAIEFWDRYPVVKLINGRPPGV